jgi:hypothetical protein
LAAILKILERAQLWVMIYFCVKFQRDPLYGLNLTFFAPWLPWQRLHFECFQPPKAATHTILVCYGGHFEPRMATKIQKSSDLGEIWFPT